MDVARASSVPYTLADIPATASEVRSATWEEALTRNPAASAIRAIDLSQARRFTFENNRYSRSEAEYFMEERGLKGEFTFDDRDYNEIELGILASRKEKEVRRREILARAEGSGSSVAGRFGISLAGSMLDPINVASVFIPVIGPSRYALMLERAGSAVGRAGVRAGVGAAEGVVGAALVEPLIVGAAMQEQADYTFADSFLNVVIGGVFGGGLHVTGGLVQDRLRPLPSRALPDEAEKVIPVKDAPDVGALAGPIGVVDEYHDAARRLSAAIHRARDIDLSNPAAVSKIAGRQVLSISQYVRETGGIVDDGGELSARDVTAKSMPGLIRKKGTQGADMDDVRQRLFDAGYFPSKKDYNEVSDSEIFDAISNDLAGERTYAADVGDLVARIHAERDFVQRLESQGITRDMDVDQVASRLRDLDDDARALEPQDREGSEGFDEYERAMAREVVASADLPTREAATRVSVAQAATGEPIEVRPVFNRSQMLDAARRIGDPDELPLSDRAAVDRADEALGGPDPVDIATVQKNLADLEAQVKALQDEAGIDAGKAAEFVAVIRGDLEAAQQAGKDAKELSRAAAMLATCAMRHAV
jgi:hypothetical protein